MVPFSFLLRSILGGGGRAAKRKTDPKYSAYGLHVDMGSLRISCGPGVVAVKGPLSLQPGGLRAVWEVRGVSVGSHNLYQLCCH